MKKETIKESILNPVSMFIIGLLTGFLIKEIDIHLYAQHFGISLANIFSEAGVWVVIGVSISLFSIVFIGILIYLLFIKKYTEI